MTELAATTALTPTSTPEARDDRMPSGIPFIVANEFAERFCYYGINVILSVYMAEHLHLKETETTVVHSMFKAAAYFFPLLGAVVADVFWGRYRTILTFSLVYATGCAIVALVPGEAGLIGGLALVAIGTGGIKPCVSSNVGDQFTAKNNHLIERAFTYFYLSINLGSAVSMTLCPLLLARYGRLPAFGLPAIAMFVATLFFWLGRSRYVTVPPAGKKWIADIVSPEGRMTVRNLAAIYVFVAFFWALWEQSNGQTFTLQAESSLMDKYIGFGMVSFMGKTMDLGFIVDPAQISVVNGIFIVTLIPIFSLVIFPLVERVVPLTPLRKIGFGLFLVAIPFLILGRVEAHIQAGEHVSVWWQILAYLVLSAAEVLVSMTGLEFSFKQAPLRMKSFIMSMFLVSASMGNVITGMVNVAIQKPVVATAIDVGADTWVHVADATEFVPGQTIDFNDKTGINTVGKNGEAVPLSGTFLVAAVDAPSGRVKLMDRVDRKPVASSGSFDKATGVTSTTWLVGRRYWDFFAVVMILVAALFVPVAKAYRARDHVREDDALA